MMFNALDVGALRFRIEPKKRKEPRQRGVPMLNGQSDLPAFMGENEAAIFFVLHETGAGQFLHHAGHRGLADFERGRDVHHAGIAFRLDQFVDAFEIILGTLTRGSWRGHDDGIKQYFPGEASHRRLPCFDKSGIFRCMKYPGFLLVAIVVGLGVVSCDRKSPAPTGEPNPAPAVSMTTTQVFQVNGVIVELIPTEKSVRIRHEEVPDYMPAMTMPFEVLNTNELAGLNVGDPVAFRMTVTETTGWIDQIKQRVVDPAELNQIILPANAPLRIVRDVEPLAVGDLLPDYWFTNQLGRAVSLAGFRGKALAITFIFTRCPYPTFCPLMSNNFKAAYAALRQNSSAPTNWHLLEITIDPEFDTPERLKAYAATYQADPQHWSFLTGPLIEVTAITEQFGLQFTREPGGGINHNLRTIVVAPSGRVQKIIPENKWTADELVAEVLKATAKR
jgi:protein SCO1/2